MVSWEESPRYLQAFSGQRSIQENIAQEIMQESTFLYV